MSKILAGSLVLLSVLLASNNVYAKTASLMIECSSLEEQENLSGTIKVNVADGKVESVSATSFIYNWNGSEKPATVNLNSVKVYTRTSDTVVDIVTENDVITARLSIPTNYNHTDAGSMMLKNGKSIKLVCRPSSFQENGLNIDVNDIFKGLFY